MDQLLIRITEALADSKHEDMESVGVTIEDYVDTDILQQLEQCNTDWEFTFMVDDQQVLLDHRGLIIVNPDTAESNQVIHKSS